MLKNNFLNILSVLFLLVTSIISSTSAHAEKNDYYNSGQSARIIIPKAIVYSDEMLNTPIGYIVNGKYITVGKPRNQNPDVYPIVIYGRLAYIESKSFQFIDRNTIEINSKKGIKNEHDVDIVLATDEEKLTENNSFYFSIGQFSAGAEATTLYSYFNGSEKSNALDINARFIHRQTKGKLIWGAGFSVLSMPSENVKLNAFMISPTFGFTPYRNSFYIIDIIGSLDISSSGSLVISTNYVNDPNPFIWGPRISAQAVFFPYQKYHACIGIDYRKYNVLNIKTVVDENDLQLSGITSFGGAGIYGGLGIEF